MVGAEGFEPPTSCSQSRRDTGLRYAPTSTSLPPTQKNLCRVFLAICTLPGEGNPNHENHHHPRGSRLARRPVPLHPPWPRSGPCARRDQPRGSRPEHRRHAHSGPRWHSRQQARHPRLRRKSRLHCPLSPRRPRLPHDRRCRSGQRPLSRRSRPNHHPRPRRV